MQVAKDTRKEFHYQKDTGKWYWYEKNDGPPDVTEGTCESFDSFLDALCDAVEPYVDADAEEEAAADEVERLLAAMTPIPGEVRRVEQCRLCGMLVGRRFIPHGLGRGLVLNPCTCITTNNQHKSMKVIKEVSP